MSILFLVDFDGTVTEVDTVEAMVKKFARGDWKSLNKLWEDKVIDTEEVARRTFASFDADEQDIISFIATMKIDPSFIEFVDAVEKNGDRLYIVSDGYDYLIQRILNREGLSRVPFFSNKMWIQEREFSMMAGGIRPSCGQCGTCKRNAMEALVKPGETVVFVGDGYSDFCIARYVDVVFAKSVLLEHCKRMALPCLPYKTFADILKWYRK